MKAVLKTFGVVAFAGAMSLRAFADGGTTSTNTDSKDLKKVIEDQGINYVQTAQKGITLSGYVEASYTEQFSGPTHPFTQTSVPVGAGTSAPPYSTANLRQFDINNNNFNVNAVKVALEQALPSNTNTWAAGFRIDTIYGQDATILSASDPGLLTPGGSTSDFYLEQALVKFNIPVGNGLQIYAGKFVTLLGYEVIESPANPNFSRGLLFTNAIPLTNTGVYADYKFNSTVEAKLGVVDGWNSSVSPTVAGSDYSFGGKGLTGQLVLNAPGGNANLTQSFIWTPQADPGAGTPNNGGGGYYVHPGVGTGPLPGYIAVSPNTAPTNSGTVVYDIWGNWTPTFDKSGNTTLGFNIDYGNNSYSWYGAAVYAQYKVSKLLTLSGRGEYLHSDAGANKFGAGGYYTSGPGIFTPHVTNYYWNPTSQDDYSYTLTASFNIWDNLLTRLEYRIDDLSKGTTGTNSQVQNEISLDAVYSFLLDD